VLLSLLVLLEWLLPGLQLLLWHCLLLILMLQWLLMLLLLMLW